VLVLDAAFPVEVGLQPALQVIELERGLAFLVITLQRRTDTIGAAELRHFRVAGLGTVIFVLLAKCGLYQDQREQECQESIHKPKTRIGLEY
jgi:hypothetical protein